jgi:tartrate-resistant acid phosphatase type 5
VWGNHDVGGTSTATVLGATSRYYTFAQGPLRVLVLDANDPFNSAQVAFLRATLAAAQEPVRIVAFHQPVRTAGLHAPLTGALQAWEPIFLRYGVAMVLQGHNHDYERIRAGRLTYVTTGGGGAPLYPCIRRPAGLVRCVSTHNFLLVTADAQGVSVRAVDRAGRTIDRFTVPVPTPAAA